MTREKAKLLLQSSRPGGQDRDDPQFAEALALAEKDPHLKTWFEEQRAWDRAMTVSLERVPVPVELKDKLLEEVRSVRAGEAKEVVDSDWWSRVLHRGERVLSYPILNFPKGAGSRAAVWNWRPAAAIAAGLIMLTAMAWWWNTRPITFTAFCQEVTESAWDLSPHLQYESQRMSEVRNWLAARQVQTRLDLPAGLQNAHLRGCSVIEWHGRKIPVLCLLEGSCHMHLLITEGLVLADIPGENQPELLDFGLIRTASWRNKDRTYVLTGLKMRTFVRKFRQAGQWNLTS